MTEFFARMKKIRIPFSVCMGKRKKNAVTVHDFPTLAVAKKEVKRETRPVKVSDVSAGSEEGLHELGAVSSEADTKDRSFTLLKMPTRRETMYESFVQFHRGSNATLQSNLSRVLSKQFAASKPITRGRGKTKATLAESISTKGDMNRLITSINKFKTSMNKQQKEKTPQDSKGPNIESKKIDRPFLASFKTMTESASTVVWKKNASQVVDKVCAQLNKEILTIAEVDILSRFNAIRPGALKHEQTDQRVNLAPYLNNLVLGLDRWYTEAVREDLTGTRCMILSVYYLRKIKHHAPDFTLSEYNVHKIMATLMLISAKFTEDEAISNDFWSEVSGIALDELNELESSLCITSGLDFRIDKAELQKIYVEFDFQDTVDTTSRNFSSIVMSSVTTKTKNHQDYLSRGSDL